MCEAESKKGDGDGKQVKEAIRRLGEDAEAPGDDAHRHLEPDQPDNHCQGKPGGAAPGGKHITFPF